MTDTLATWGGWEPAIRDDPFGHFAEARGLCPVQRVRLADGHTAWVVLGYDAARQALNDPRISKDMLAALRDNGDVVAEGLPGPAAASSSSRPPAIAQMAGSSAATRPGVKARDTSRRSLVWSGGSTLSMCRENSGPGRPSATTSPSSCRAASMSLEMRGSLSARRAAW